MEELDQLCLAPWSFLLPKMLNCLLEQGEKSLNRNQETCHVTGLVTIILTLDFLIISL